MDLSSRRHFLYTLTLASGALLTGPLLTGTVTAREGEAVVEWYDKQCGPYLQNPTERSVTILWKTKEPGLAWVEYWPVGKPGERKVAQDAAFGLRRLKTPRHQVTVTGLEPGAVYAYKVYSRAKEKGPDVIAPSDGVDCDGTFKTLDEAAERGRFFVFNDMHGRGELFAGLLEKGKADQCDLIFHNGDIVDWISDEKTMYDKVLSPMRDYISKVPLVFIRGNHEYRGGMALEVTDFFPPREGRYYYSLRQGPVCFLVLDTGEDKADERKELFGLTDWESYFAEQQAWLSKAVRSPEFTSSRYRVVIQHIPIMGRNAYTERKIMEQWAPIFNEAGIDMMIGGHTHRNSFAGANERGVNFPILINDNKGYVTVDADRSRMKVEHFDGEGHLLRELSIKPD